MSAIDDLIQALEALKQKPDGTILYAAEVHDLVDGIFAAMEMAGNVTVTTTPIEGGNKVTITDPEGVVHEFDVMDGVDGTDGADGAPGHNPNLGTYLDTDTNKPTSGQAGDYIIVIDTTVTPRTASVWAWNGSTFADTEKSVEDFGVQFASGQPVANVHIKDENGDDDPNAQGVLSAEAGAELAEKTNEVNVGSAASLSAAIALVPQGMRKLGVKVTFMEGTTTNNSMGWTTVEFVGNSVDDWSDTDKWKSVGDRYSQEYYAQPAFPKHYTPGYFSSSGTSYATVGAGTVKVAWIKVYSGDVLAVKTFLNSSSNKWIMVYCDHIPAANDAVEPLYQGVYNQMNEFEHPIIKDGYVGVRFNLADADHDTTIQVVKNTNDFAKLVWDTSLMQNAEYVGDGEEVIDSEELENVCYNQWNRLETVPNFNSYTFDVEDGYFYVCSLIKVADSSKYGTITFINQGKPVLTKNVEGVYVIMPKCATSITVLVNNSPATSVKKYPLSSLVSNSSFDTYKEAVLTNIGKASIEKSVAALSDGIVNFEDSYPKYSKTGGCLTLDAKITSFGKVELGTNPNDGDASTWGGNLKCVIDSDKVQIVSRNRTPNVISTFYHGLDIGTFIRVSFSWYDYHYRVIVSTLDGIRAYRYDDDVVWEIAGAPFVRVNAATSLTDVVVRVENSKMMKPIWVFGDSYTSVADTRWPYYVYNEFGVRDFYLCGRAGGDSSENDMLGQFRKATSLGCPRYIVWALGMNDSEPDNYTRWKNAFDEVKQYCEENGVVMIGVTIPNTPTMTNTDKNAYVENHANRIWDAADSVGASEASSAWYTGCLDEDNVHPTSKGAKVLAGSLITAVPELMNYSLDGDFSTLTRSNVVLNKASNNMILGGKALDLYYDITSANTTVTVCVLNSTISPNIAAMYVDDVVVEPSAAIEFATVGKHKVSFVLNSYEIPAGMFFNISTPELVTVVLPNTIKGVGINNFYGSKLKTLVIPESVSYINSGCFKSCANLNKIILLSSISNNITVDSNAFVNSNSGVVYHFTETDFSIFTGKVGSNWMQREIVSTIEDLL